MTTADGNGTTQAQEQPKGDASASAVDTQNKGAAGDEAKGSSPDAGKVNPLLELVGDDADTREWLGKLSGAYIFPKGILGSVNFEHRSGNPTARTVQFTGGRQIPNIVVNVEEVGSQRLLVDCGMFQGLKELRERNWAPPGFDAAGVQWVLLTHAHIDHSGYLPRLGSDGFQGTVLCTAPTLDLLKLGENGLLRGQQPQEIGGLTLVGQRELLAGELGEQLEDLELGRNEGGQEVGVVFGHGGVH